MTLALDRSLGILAGIAPRVALAAAALGALLAPVGPAVDQETAHSSERVAVRVAQSDLGKLSGVDVLRAVDYGPFLVLELTAADVSTLRARGLDLGASRPLSLRLQGFEIDTAGEPELELATPGPGGRGFHLLQLAGPAKQVWMDALEAEGVELLQYIQPHTYLVRADAAQVAAAAGREFVRWAGAYLPAYRWSDDLRSREGFVTNVSVSVYDGGSLPDTVEWTLAAIGRLGGVLVERESARASDPFVTALFGLHADALPAVAALPEVAWLSYRAPIDELEDEMSAQIIAGNFDPLDPGYAAWLTMVGLSGNGVTLAVIDSGFDTGVDGTSHPDLSGRLIMIPDGGNNIPIDNNGHGTHVGGIMAGNGSLGTLDASGFLMGLGVAPQATLAVRFNNNLDATRTRDAVLNGAVASNNSYRLHAPGLGYEDSDRTYDILVRDADQTTGNVAEPLIIVFSAGNSGNAGCTKEAKNIIAVANSFNNRDGSGNPGGGNIDTLNAGSSRGPAGDGRIYPHVTAPGSRVISTRSSLGSASCLTIPNGAPGPDPTYSICSGTSMAAPHVTGAAGLLVEWWRGFNGGADPSPAMVKALLVNGAVDMGTPDIPNGNEGWGRIDLGNVIASGLPAIYEDQLTLFTDTGQTFSKTLSAADPTRPLKITLAWTDAPGPGGGGNPMALVNDLDLVVTDPATSFLGNVFANGFSTTGGSADAIDNLECVFIEIPHPGNFFTVTVTAAGINGDGVPYNGDATDQDFAIVYWNALPNVSPPVALCQDVTVVADDNCEAEASIDNGSFDPDGDPIELEQDPPGPYPLGQTLVTLTVTDDKGATDSCQATVTVVDETDPVITCPADTTVVCGESTHPDATGHATATDNCDPDPLITWSDEVAPTDCPADPVQAVITRTWTATDFSGNDSSCEQTITVLKQVWNLDVKPGSCPNAYNPFSGQGGRLPISIVGTADFDIADIDPSSILLSRKDCVGGAVAPVWSRPEDSATPFDGAPCGCHTLAGGDGILDLSLKFIRREVTEALQLDGFAFGDAVEVVVSGTLNDGCEFIAIDCIVIRR